MKKLMGLTVTAIITLSMVGCGKSQLNDSSIKEEPTKVKNIIEYPKGYDTTSSGASSFANSGDHKDSPYFSQLDIYNLKFTDTLTILSEFETYQQTTEVTCGPASALMVLNHFGENNYHELQIAELMKCHKDLNGNNTEEPGVANEQGEIGTSTDKMVKFFEEIGWEVDSSLVKAQKDGYTFYDYNDFKDFVLENINNNTPIMVEWIDWSGHWSNIIGYDTMGTESTLDDVLILADPYDTSDHSQDGYKIYSSERFFYMWLDNGMLPEDQSIQQWLVAKPKN